MILGEISRRGLLDVIWQSQMLNHHEQVIPGRLVTSRRPVINLALTDNH